MYLSKKDKAIILGLILGDGYLQKTGKKNARLRLEHSDKQKEYLLWKIKLLPRLFLGRPNYLERKHPKTKRTYKYWRHQSNATPYLGSLRKLFYPNNKKIIPDNLSLLVKDPITLAIWYMDDGYYCERDKTAHIYLGRVSKQEAEIVSKMIFHNFNIKNKVVDKKHKGFVIYFPNKSIPRLQKVIGRYIIQSMKYKLPF